MEIATLASISIHAPRAGGDKFVHYFAHLGCISIHAPRAGGDLSDSLGMFEAKMISIHAPRAGGDHQGGVCVMVDAEDFNPRPPCGGRLGGILTYLK